MARAVARPGRPGGSLPAPAAPAPPLPLAERSSPPPKLLAEPPALSLSSLSSLGVVMRRVPTRVLTTIWSVRMQMRPTKSGDQHGVECARNWTCERRLRSEETFWRHMDGTHMRGRQPLQSHNNSLCSP
eukprot:SM000021S06511  [mRNA]  locus=s21:790635:793666:- [translate_table: standard]